MSEIKMLRLIIQIYFKEDLINTGSTRILYMTFEPKLKEPEVAVMLLELMWFNV